MTPEQDNVVILPAVADDPVFQESIPVPGDFATPEPVQAPRQLGSDPHDFAALFMRHRWSFALHARRFLSDQRDIDEVVQEGFLKLFLALPELETELQALAYARRTITNLCIDRYRADQRRPRLVDLEALTPEVLAEDEEIDPVVAAEDAALVREALALLSPLHREALLKREVEEKPLPQIAAELDIPVEQVKHVLHRARQALRRLLVGTHVEPGVDLDLATVLAANRARAAAAAKPTGAAALALLLILVGVLGLRSSRDQGTVVGAVPTAAPGTFLEPATQHGVVGQVPSAPATTGTTTGPRALRPAQATPAARPTTAATTSAPARGSAGTPAATPPTTSPVSTPVVPPVTRPTAPPVTQPVAPSSRLNLSGLLAATRKPAIQTTQTFDHPSGDSKAAFSQFVAPTTEGNVVLNQTLTRDAATGAVTYVADTALPVDGASIPATLGATDQTVLTPAVTKQADGTVQVVLDTTFTLPQAAGSALPTTDRFVVQALYAADLTTVLAENVQVGGPSDPVATLAPAAPDHPRDPTTDGATVRPGPSSTKVSIGRENPDGRDQEPLPSSF